ncbi:alpha/beta fold hydrolase [Streptomyces sp. C10-9-1]|uniref:alpha/beta fold hydrolase n=1 Tax=Streptomyces sp. C10-9-1 TaxID=1859285 RepID=UPI003D7294A5
MGAGYRVTRCGFRSFGGSPLPDRGSYGDAEDVVRLMDHLEVGRAALVGASYGGQVALEVTAANSQPVSALALLCSAAPDQGARAGSALRHRAGGAAHRDR